MKTRGVGQETRKMGGGGGGEGGKQWDGGGLEDMISSNWK